MNTNVFVVFTLSLTLAFSYFYTALREYYSPTKELRAEVRALENKVQDERFKNELVEHEITDFRNYVATLLPSAIKAKGDGEKSYPLRSLASVVQKHTNEKLNIETAKLAFESAKKLFRDQKFELATKALNAVVKNHPYSAYLPEAMFLLVESHFQLRENDRSVYWANQMIELYPENELTGYAMIRLGKIFEQQERHEEAMEIYKTVLKSFPQRDLASVADHALRAEQL
jgi:TolA-binding protein